PTKSTPRSASPRRFNSSLIPVQNQPNDDHRSRALPEPFRQQPSDVPPSAPFRRLFGHDVLNHQFVGELPPVNRWCDSLITYCLGSNAFVLFESIPHHSKE